jgi:hypothetical protein
VRCVLDCMKIVCRLLVTMAILTVGLVQVSLAAESNDLASAYHRAEQMRANHSKRTSDALPESVLCGE